MSLLSSGHYLSFAIGCLLGYPVWIWLVVTWRRRPTAHPLLNERERLAWELATADALQQSVQQDPAACQQWLAHYLDDVPHVGQRRRAELPSPSSDAIYRLLLAAVRQLTDDNLLRLAERLPSLRPPGLPPIHRTRRRESPPTRFPRPQIATALGLAVLLLMVLFPPWVLQRTRHTHVIGQGRTAETLERTPAGFRWVASSSLPVSRLTYRNTQELRRLEHDELTERVDYGQITLQLIVHILAVSLFVRPKPS